MKNILKAGMAIAVAGFTIDGYLIDLITGWDLVRAINILRFTSVCWLGLIVVIGGLLFWVMVND